MKRHHHGSGCRFPTDDGDVNSGLRLGRRCAATRGDFTSGSQGRRHAVVAAHYRSRSVRAPRTWPERIARRFTGDPQLIALSGNYRFHDWDWWGRTLLRAHDFTLGPATHVLVKYVLRIGVAFCGGNFAVIREALERIGGFDTSIECHGEDTNLGRRLSRVGRVELRYDCFLYTSARRYNAMGKGAVFRLYLARPTRSRATSTTSLQPSARSRCGRPT